MKDENQQRRSVVSQRTVARDVILPSRQQLSGFSPRRKTHQSFDIIRPMKVHAQDTNVSSHPQKLTEASLSLSSTTTKVEPRRVEQASKKPLQPTEPIKKPSSNTSSSKKKKSLKGYLKSSAFRYGLAACIILATALVGADVMRTNNQLKEDLKTAVASLGDPRADVRQSNEGRDETPVAPSAIDTYKVAPSMPRVLSIPKIKLRARIMPMDVNPDNSLQAPINVFDAGWYSGSAKPGEPGAALIDGHASGMTRMGLFAYLDTLTKGDKVEVETGSGKKYIYEVVMVEKVERTSVDMKSLLTPYQNIPQGLNLITCTGKYLKNEKTYDHRATVYTKLISES
jgi:LPXTG-site transpeptidase (sortase) family protein